MIETTGERWYERLDSAGAVYGSLLAASVVLAQSPLQVAVPPGELAVLLLGTGAVFWLVHVYTRTVGRYVASGRFTWSALARAAEDESPIALAALPPAAAALVAGALGGSPSAAAWWAFVTALCGQLAWAVAATRQVGAPVRVTVVSVLINLALGLVLVVLKVAIAH